MASRNPNDTPIGEVTEFAINQWKIDLVGTFFLKKQDRFAKRALVFEDCDISNICVSNDDTTEIIYDDNEDTLTSSPVPVCVTSMASARSARPSFSSASLLVTNNSDKVKDDKNKLQCQKNSCDKLKVSKLGTSDHSSSELDAGEEKILEIEARNQFAQDLMEEVSDCTGALGTAITSSVSAASSMITDSSVSLVLSDCLTMHNSSATLPLVSVPAASLGQVNNCVLDLTDAIVSSTTGVFAPTSFSSSFNIVPISSASLFSCDPSFELLQLNKPLPSSGSPLQASNIKDQDRNCITVVSEAPVLSSAKPVSSNSAASVHSSSAVAVSCVAAPITSVISVSTPLPEFSTGSVPEKIKVPTSRPILNKTKSSVPQAAEPCEQGRNCVSVILKSSRLDPKHTRLNTIAKRLEKVEQLVSRYSLKFGHTSSPGVQVRLDYCFHKSSEARQFFIAVHSLEQTKSPPKLLSCFLLTDSELGYEYDPVLTEYDLLAIQSPSYCRNIFRTPVLIKVVQEGDTVAFQFKSVTDVNRFLFNKGGSLNTRSLGHLRINAVPKKMVSDDEGLYHLFTEEREISSKFGYKHKFKVKARMEYGDEVSLLGGNLLLFSSKFDLFKFLFSEDAADLDHLQFDRTKIVNCPAGTIEKIEEKLIKFSNKQSEKRSYLPGEDDKGCHSEYKAEAGEKGLEKGAVNILLKAEKAVPVTDKLQDAIGDTVLSVCVQHFDSLPKDQHCSKGAVEELLVRSEGEAEGKELENVGLIEKDEVTEISTIKKNEVKETVPEAELRLRLALKEEEIYRLKRKLMAKEKLIETEIQRKIAVNSDLKEACVQLEKIHQLSLSLPRNVGPLE